MEQHRSRELRTNGSADEHGTEQPQRGSRDERGYERTGERHTLTRICGTQSAQQTPPHAVGRGTSGETDRLQ
ncbi:hypothetical protein COCON_G00214790 [Conger conger]|uniref:Uncharacterized protein n=1 Tax=Conger conger TaxID=82655 RepID=A0A9Q1HMA7_CONCO|nr:hypothetical protein COCON_G00214790 [Conger conger]